MSIDLTTLITNLQADVDAVDSSTSMSSILSLLHKARKITSISNYYDSAGLLPVDSSYDGMLAFSKADNTMYKFVDSGLDAGTVQGWHKADSAFSTPPPPGQAGIGSTQLYSFGTRANVTPSAIYQNKETISFASDAKSTQPGLLAESTYYAAAGGTATYGYVIGGVAPNRSPSNTGVVMRHTLASTGHMTNMPVQVPNAQQTNSTPLGPGSNDYVYYLTGGYPNTNSIHKYGEAGDAPYVDVGDIAVAIKQTATTNSGTHGYVMGGVRNSPPYTFGNIEKFPFATDENATDVGDLAVSVFAAMGAITPTHGYSVGGFNSGGKNTIQKFAFASDGNASDVADMAETRYEGGAGQSQTHIYTVGGQASSTVADKTPYASDTNSTTIGSLNVPRYQHTSTSH